MQYFSSPTKKRKKIKKKKRKTVKRAKPNRFLLFLKSIRFDSKKKSSSSRKRAGNATLSSLHAMPDISLIITVALLSIGGILMIFSASAVIAYIYNDGNTFYFVIRQIIWVSLGSIIAYILYLLPIRYLKRLSLIILFVGAGLMFIMLPEALGGVAADGTPAIDIPFVKTINGATRWIGLPLFDLQPSEFMKFAFITYIAAWLTNKKEDTSKSTSENGPIVIMGFLFLHLLIAGVLLYLNVDIFVLVGYGVVSIPTFLLGITILIKNQADSFYVYFSQVLAPFFILLGSVSALVLAQRDLDTTVIIGLTILCIFYAAYRDLIHNFGTALTASLASGFGLIALYGEGYRRSRLDVFWELIRTGSIQSDVIRQGSGFQVYNGLVALGSGGLWGLGYGESRQKLFYLQEAAYTDSIFVVLGEEFGFFGVLFVIIGFLYLGSIGLKIASKSNDTFSSLLAIGMTSWIVIQAFLNMAANLSIIPFGGMPLPFFTYGGSSTLTIFMAVGVLLNVSKLNNKT